MKTYWSIPHKIDRDLPIYAFNKLDGSNIRAEWCRKTGFSKFGTKQRLLSEEEKPFGEAISIFRRDWEESLVKIFKEQRYEKVVVFFEFFGPNSFAGNHVEEEHELVLIDVAPYKKGILPPQEFLKLFGHLNVPKVLYQGKAGVEFEEKVKSGQVEGLTFEGVVCKGLRKKQLRMFKIKNRAWLDRLRDYCKGDEKLFNELS